MSVTLKKWMDLSAWMWEGGNSEKPEQLSRQAKTISAFLSMDVDNFSVGKNKTYDSYFWGMRTCGTTHLDKIKWFDKTGMKENKNA